MSSDRTISAVRGRVTLFVAFAALHIAAMHTVAQAQVFGEIPTPEFISAPAITPVAAPAATPALTSAEIGRAHV